ncbi:hypothetical protein CVT26_002438 [Gymnopilus dilepis]|uniref:HAT C-terminal dimerisation domain-containing protein n=1 Tax=Gymnopilus dilepis TaxID=231916 RepID=A0A409Y3S3_9AGAR|nr:hypothetical protein CVT26_002438 [Gymnopilus dilepis]
MRHAMARGRSGTTKKRSKKSNTKELPNGALQTTFQVDVNAVGDPQENSQSGGGGNSIPREDNPRSPHVTFEEPVEQLNRDSVGGVAAPTEPPFAPPNNVTPQRTSGVLPQTPSRAPPTSPGAETFPSPSSAWDSGSEADHSPGRRRQLVGTPSRNPGEPRAGRHSPRSAAAQKHHSNNRRKDKKKALDVRSFFSKDSNSCIFCDEKHSVNANYPTTRYSLKTSTHILHRHLCECHGDEWIAACDKLGIDITTKAAQSDAEDLRQKFSQEAFLDALVDFVTSEGVSINIVESPKLRALFLMLREDLKNTDIPHRTSVREHIMATWEKHLETLQAEMGAALGKISFTADVWSDPNLVPYMAVTGHWIQVKTIHLSEGPLHILSLRSELIAFHHLEGRHSGALRRLSLGSWRDTGYCQSTNDTLMECLERDLKSRGIQFDCIIRRIRCFPHVVNLACQAVIKVIGIEMSKGVATGTFLDKVTEDPIGRLRALIRTIRASSLRREAFSKLSKEQFVQELQLLRDMEVIFKFLAPGGDFDELRRYELSEDDWKAFLDILSIPHAFQQALSSEKTPILCNTISHFHAIIQVWKEYQAEHPSELFDVVQAGIDKLQDYYDVTSANPTYIMAMVLNPQLKLMWHYKHAPEEALNAKNIFIRQLRPYYRQRLSQAAQARPPTTPRRQPRTSRHGPQSAAPSGQHRTPQPRTPRQQTGAPESNEGPNATSWTNRLLTCTNPAAGQLNGSARVRSLEDEIEAYLLDVQTAESSIGFWQANQRRFPTLFLAALDYLPIQGYAVPCERVFSSAKETITMRRNSMGYDLMEARQMLKFSRRNHGVLDFSVGIKVEEELMALAQLPDEVVVMNSDPFSAF